jgi:L-alanine-DL-glutamate epimerase-like enolase superfamily enzyme
MNGYDAIADLPIAITDCDLRRLEGETTSEFTRVSTEIRLSGRGHTGVGEDVTYETAHHDALQRTGPPPLEGKYDLDTFSEIVGDLDLFPDDEPEREDFRHYRRWGFESAALDLALKQADESLADGLGTSYDPVRFVVSTRLGDPPTTDRVESLLAEDPNREFKLDATPEWDDDLVATLADTDAVRIVDLKAHYEGTDVDSPADPDLYRRILDGFPDAIVEDPAVTDETEPILADHWDRLSWDAPFHDVSDLEDLPETGCLNLKPSRFGSVESLLEAIEHARTHGKDVYFGGQFELGAGREHLHAFASLVCPDAPNDVAPRGYNDPEYDGPLPASPLDPPTKPTGLEWSG